MSSSVFIESAVPASLRPETLVAGSEDGVIGRVATADSNLVVVYGKKGTNFDQRGLEKIIEEKAISSISVIRISSPTPSMQDEEDRAGELDDSGSDEELENHGPRGSNTDSNAEDDDKSSDASSESSNNADNKRTGKDPSSDDDRETLKSRSAMKIRRKFQNINFKSQRYGYTRRRVRPSIFGLTVEEFYPEADANVLIKDVLRKAGLPTLKPSDYEFQLFVIMNDHCYTPFTPADEINHHQTETVTVRKEQPPEPQVVRRKVRIQPPQKGLLRPGGTVFTRVGQRGKLLVRRPVQKLKAIRPVDTPSDDENDDNEDIDVSSDEDDDEVEGENSESEVSAETDNDRDSDLDFNVTNRTIGKRKILKLKKLKRLSVAAKTQHQPQFRRRRPSQDEQDAPQAFAAPTQRMQKPMYGRPCIVDPLRTGGKKIWPAPNVSPSSSSSVSTPSTVRSFATKLPIVTSPVVSQHPKFLSDAVAAMPPIPKKLPQTPPAPPSAVVGTVSPATAKIMPQKTLPITVGMRRVPVVQGGVPPQIRAPVQQRTSTPPPPSQAVKEIIINKVMASPKGGFTDIGALLQSVQPSPSPSPSPVSGESLPAAKDATPAPTTPNAPTTSQQAVARPVVSASPSPSRKVFTPLVIESAAKNQLPAQISLQMHQSRSELAAEHDKQLDLIDSIVKDELQQTGGRVEQSTAPIHSDIPKLVKMLESTEQALEANAAFMPSSVIADLVSAAVESVEASAPAPLATPDVAHDDLDIGSAPLLAAVDDEIPEDLLQHMVKLIEDHQSLREEVEKQVFGEANSELASVIAAPHSLPTPPPPPVPVATVAPIFQASLSQQAAPASLTATVASATETMPKKSIIEMAISNVPEAASRSPQATMFARKEPIQIVRGNGRVITLPPIEAPTTRAKRRAQAPVPLAKMLHTNADTPTMYASFNESSLDSSLQSDASFAVGVANITESTDAVVIEQTTPTEAATRRRAPRDGAPATEKPTKAKGRRSATSATSNTSTSKANDANEPAKSQEDDDDPNRLWCICRQPHNNRFMICCDACEDWFHGTCVSITKAMGKVMEQNGVEWTCPKCLSKLEEKKQRKITEMLPIKKVPTPKRKSSTGASPAIAVQPETPPAATQPPISTSEPPADDATPKRPAEVSPRQQVKTPKPLLTSAQRKFFASTPIPVAPTTVLQTPSPASLPVKRTTISQTTPSPKTIPIQARQAASPAVKESPKTQKPPECIVCRKFARPASIYCSDECIRRHAQSALNNFCEQATSGSGAATLSPTKSPSDDVRKKKAKGLFEDLLAMPDRKLKAERVNVYQRSTGRVLTGSTAPTTHNLRKWIQDNPTFEVVQPGSPLALEIEKKQKLRAAQLSPMNAVRHQPTVTVSPTAVAGGSAVASITSSPVPASAHYEGAAVLRVMKPPPDQGSKQTSSPLSVLPKQLAKYPQQVTIRPDRVSKSFEHPAAKDDARERATREKALKRLSSEGTTGSPTKRQSEADTEASVRMNVRRTLRDLLMQRMSEVGVEGAPQLTAAEVEAFVRKTESEMYDCFNRETNAKYKAKYRSLIFNIKDPKNKTLFAKICARTVEPRQLVRMSAEELASQELAQWREKEAKHQLEMIKKSELDLLSCAKNYVLKTHKGEEVIEDKTTERFSLDMSISVEDVVSALNKSSSGAVNVADTRDDKQYQSARDREPPLHSEPDHQQERTEKEDTKTKSSSKEGEKSKERDRSRVTERSHDRDRDRRQRSREHHRERSRTHKRSRSHSRSRSRSREKRYKSSHKDERRDKERNRDKDRERARHKDRDHNRDESEKKMPEKKLSQPAGGGSGTKSSASSNKEQRPSTASKTKPKLVEPFSLIDKILESSKTVEEAANLVSDEPAKEEPQVALAAPQSPAQSAVQIEQKRSDEQVLATKPSPTQDSYARLMSASAVPTSILWTGTINMIDVASFQIALQPVVGSSILGAHNRGRFLPVELDVVGRIGPETVWDYISKIKKSPNKEIAIVRLVPAMESETSAYTILYQYLYKRKRLGVIKTSSPQIKDFYIFPLGASQQMPSILRSTERVEFYEDSSRPDMLMGILILVIGKRSTVSSAQQQPVVSIAAASAAALKFPRRTNDDALTFTPPGSPKRRKRSHSAARKNESIDLDAIIKAPIASKRQKSAPVAPPAAPPPATVIDDADEPYSPGGGGSDDDVSSISTPKAATSFRDVPQQSSEEKLKLKMAELNRQIAAQEMEIAGLLSADQRYAATSSKKSTVLANISIPKNLSQILASIKAPSAATPPPPHIGSLLNNADRTDTADDEYNPEHHSMPPPALPKPYEASVKIPEKSSTSRLARLSEAELLSMVPDELMQQPPRPTSSHAAEPPPPGV